MNVEHEIRLRIRAHVAIVAWLVERTKRSRDGDRGRIELAAVYVLRVLGFLFPRSSST